MKRTTVKLPDELDARLRHEAQRRGTTASQLTREAIEAISVPAGRAGAHCWPPGPGEAGGPSSRNRSRGFSAPRWAIALLVDAGPLNAYVDRNDAHHAECLELLEEHPGPLIVPVLVITEAVYVIGTRLGVGPEIRFLGDLAAGSRLAEPVMASDWLRIAGLTGTYRDLPLGAVDASVVATAERLARAAVGHTRSPSLLSRTTPASRRSPLPSLSANAVLRWGRAPADPLRYRSHSRGAVRYGSGSPRRECYGRTLWPGASCPSERFAGISVRFTGRKRRPPLSWLCEQKPWHPATKGPHSGAVRCRPARRGRLVRSRPPFGSARLRESGPNRFNTMFIQLSALGTARCSARSCKYAVHLRPHRGDLPDDNDRCRNPAASRRSDTTAGHRGLTFLPTGTVQIPLVLRLDHGIMGRWG